MATKEKLDPAQEITSEIVALLEKGTMPWRRPWKIAAGGVPLRHNGEGYKGINAFLLGAAGLHLALLDDVQPGPRPRCLRQERKPLQHRDLLRHGRKRGTETVPVGGGTTTRAAAATAS